MVKKSLLAILMCSFGIANAVEAQDSTQVIKNDMPQRLLPYNNPMEKQSGLEESPLQPALIQLDSFQKDVMSRVSDIYQIHILSLQAQADDNPIKAEEHINDAIQASQQLLDDYPEIRNDRRFAELSRVVVSEYRSFYGITDNENEPQGEIFTIQQDFLDDEMTITENFEFPVEATIPKTQVPLLQNSQVNRHLVYYTLRRPEVMEVWRERAEVYKPMMDRIFAEEGLPPELVYLAYIESGINPTARSWASAVGMWQFIQATGRVYGLEVNWWVDERRDPEKATRAAARHLKDLHNIWGDWHLALANYNISPRGLNRAIRRAGGVKDYWAAYPYLPRETRGYVPGFIATTLINMSPEEFGFKKRYGKEPYAYDVVEVDGLMPLDALAAAINISTEDLKRLNPELLRWATPPGNKYNLKIPVGTKNEFLAAYDDIPKETANQSITMHTVSSGESIGLIARKYGTTVSGIFASNENLTTTIYPGQVLAVPLPAGSTAQLSANRPSNQRNGVTTTRSTTQTVSVPANSSSLSYKVKTGDTIGHIAEWYDVRAWQIRSWNGIGNTIRVGQNLKVYVPNNLKAHYEKVNTLSFREKQTIESQQKRGENIFASAGSSSSSNNGATYTVRRNDTLSEIAESHGVSISQLRRLNNLSGSRIYVGQVLKIK
ncbi:MAG: LysM peptidoglycan-binding domain-containing protein [Balneolaceae bacterium]|nr:LysM peptidoglycan-binding domain-containing protein [Balneolaceae bacterium]